MSILDYRSKKQVDTLMNTLILLSEIAILLGAIFQLQHYPSGKAIFWTGIWLCLIFCGIEIRRLKRIVRKLEEKVVETDQKVD